jgi:hypothetical protein
VGLGIELELGLGLDDRVDDDDVGCSIVIV